MSKPSRRVRRSNTLGIRPLYFLTSALLAGTVPVRAQQAPAPGNVLEEVIVTSQKREENLQAVPISIQALDTKKLSELQVSSFDDYARYLPSLSVQSYGPGYAQLYVRGVTNGGDGLKVGSQPLVGVYLDEMPVTTIANNLDVHIYDVARVEALSGPQGTLFGASSMAGTLRIITNKPDPSKFDAGYDLTANKFTAGAGGGKVEGFVNLPIAEHAAVRLVGWGERDGGYINNVAAPAGLTYPTSGTPRTNAGLVEKNYNWVNTVGGRGALKLDLNDSWTVTPTLETQHQKANGQFATTPYGATVSGTYTATVPGSGDLNISRYYPEYSDDTWWQATLTVQGRIGDFDVIYAGGYLNRDRADIADYTDYYSSTTSPPGVERTSSTTRATWSTRRRPRSRATCSRSSRTSSGSRRRRSGGCDSSPAPSCSGRAMTRAMSTGCRTCRTPPTRWPVTPVRSTASRACCT